VAMVSELQRYSAIDVCTEHRSPPFPLRHTRLDKEPGREKVKRGGRGRSASHRSGASRRRSSWRSSVSRVALARAIVSEPLVFLMDEPLSNLRRSAARHRRGADIVERSAPRLSTDHDVRRATERPVEGHGRWGISSRDEEGKAHPAEVEPARGSIRQPRPHAFVRHFQDARGMNWVEGMWSRRGRRRTQRGRGRDGSARPGSRDGTLCAASRYPVSRTPGRRGGGRGPACAGPDVVLGLGPKSPVAHEARTR